MKTNKFISLLFILVFAISCNNSKNQNPITQRDTVSLVKKDTLLSMSKQDTLIPSENSEKKLATTNEKEELPVVLIYNFHVTNRCPSCIAIEEATLKTLKTYFSKELKQGRIKLKVINVDDDINEKIAEHYQAFGSALYVTRLLKGKETTTDLTAEGFKFARSKEEMFIDILKTKIKEYLN